MKILTVWVIVYSMYIQGDFAPSPKDLHFPTKEDCEIYRKTEETRFYEFINRHRSSLSGERKTDSYYRSSCEQTKIAS